MKHRVLWSETALGPMKETADPSRRSSHKPQPTWWPGCSTPWMRPLPSRARHTGIPAGSDTFRQLVPPYLVYFRLDDEAMTITVLTVRHQRQRRGAVETEGG